MSATLRARIVALSGLLACAPLAFAQTVEDIAGAGRFVDIPGTSVSMPLATMTAGPDGAIYLGGVNGELLRYQPGQGTITALPGLSNLPNFGFSNLTGMSFDSTGALHVLSSSSLYRVNLTTGSSTQVGGIPNQGRAGFGPNNTLYYVSFSDSAVRARLPSGQVVLFAGDGVVGYSGDGGPAQNARVSTPQNLAVAANGDVYISDTFNARIRKVSAATGIITTVAGTGSFSAFNGPGLLATQTHIAYPQALAFDSGGNLFITFGYGYILRVDAVTNLVSIVAGTGPSGFSGDGGLAVNAAIDGPTSLSFDANDNLFLIEHAGVSSHRVRRIDRVTGIINTVIGDGSYYFCGEGVSASAACFGDTAGLSIDASGRLVVADTINNRVRRFPTSSGLTESIDFTAGSQPYGVEHDPAGNIYYTSVEQHRVYRIDAVTGARTVFAGTGVSGLSGDFGPATAARINSPNDLAFDAAGNLYIADTGNSRLRKVNAATGIISTVSGLQSLNNVNEIEVDAAGNLIIAMGWSCRIIKFNPATFTTTNVAGTGTCSSSNPGDGGLATATSMGQSPAFAIDAQGNIFTAWSSVLRRIDGVTGIITTVPLPGGGLVAPGGARVSYPFAMELDSLGRLYVDDKYYRNILRVSGLRDITPPVVQANIAGTEGNGGWYRSNVQVTWTVSDAESLVYTTTGCTATSVTADTAGVTFYCSATSTGGTTSRSVTIKRDTVAPTLTFNAASPAADESGWNSTTVLVPFSANDALSGVYSTSSASPLSIPGEGSGLTAAVQVTDFAGNTASFTSPAFDIDHSPPVIEHSVSGTVQNNGWYTSNVTIAWTVSDGVSPVRSSDGCDTTTVTTDTAGVTFTCTASSAGGTATSSLTIKRDATAPELTFGAAFPAANASGWNNGDVSIPFTVSDAISGIASTSTPSPVVISGEGAGLTREVIVTDDAGNSATFTTPVVNIDRLPPTVEAHVGGTLGSNGWYTSDVQISWTVTDSESSVTSSDGCEATTVTTDTAAVTFTCTATSPAGTATGSVTVRRDATAPLLGFGALIPAANGVGWHTTDVSIPFTTSDAMSGVASASTASPLIITGEGVGLGTGVVVTDGAGNSATFTSPAVNIDRTQPSVLPVVSGTVGNNGWYTSDVQVSWIVNESPAHIVSQSGCGTTSLTADTAGIVLSCNVVSGGGSASGSVSLKRDATAPVLTFGTITPAANANGWNKTNLSVPFTRSDAMSGLASTSATSPIVLSTEAAGVTAQVTVVDRAGNSATYTSAPRNIDKTAPYAEMETPEDAATYGFYADVAADFVCEDLSLVSCTAPVAQGAFINTASAGSKTFKVVAKDLAGFTTNHTHAYTVEAGFDFNGFLAPLRAPNTLNLVARGSLVPLRWRLPDGRGGFVTNPASFVSATVTTFTCSGSSVTLNDVATGPEGLAFDAASGTFTYNWQTNAGWTGCRKLVIKLKDNSTHEARFKFQ